MVMTARVMLGWVDPEELLADAEEDIRRRRRSLRRPRPDLRPRACDMGHAVDNKDRERRS